MTLGILFVIIFLSLLVLVHEFGHFIAAKRFGLLVEEFGIGLPPRMFGKKIGETLYSINALPFGGFVKIFGENREEENSAPEEKSKMAFYRLSAIKRAAVLFAGVAMNFLFGWLMFSLVFAVGIPRAVLIAGIADQSPAQQAGLKAGERIKGFESVSDLVSYVNANKGKPISLQIERHGKTEEIRVTPRISSPPREGSLGVSLIDVGAPPKSALASVKDGLMSSLATVGAIFAAVYLLIAGAITGQGNFFASVMGPIGIADTAAQAASFGAAYLLQLVGLVSLNLVVVNMLPFPGLDGGRLLFLLIERVKGSPLPARAEQYINTAGVFLLILLMVAILVSDARKFL